MSGGCVSRALGTRDTPRESERPGAALGSAALVPTCVRACVCVRLCLLKPLEPQRSHLSSGLLPPALPHPWIKGITRNARSVSGTGHSVPPPERLSPKPGPVCRSGHMRSQPRRAPVLLKDRHPPRPSPTPHTPPLVLRRPRHLPALLEGTAQFKQCPKQSALLVSRCHQNGQPGDPGQPATGQ